MALLSAQIEPPGALTSPAFPAIIEFPSSIANLAKAMHLRNNSTAIPRAKVVTILHLNTQIIGRGDNGGFRTR